jgi:hypothetical protein
VNQRIDEVLCTRPRPEARGRVDVPRVAQVHECAAQVLRKREGTGGGHPRVRLAADQDGRHRQPPRLEGARKTKFLRTRGRDEQHARHIRGATALQQRVSGREAAEAVRGQHERPALTCQQRA